MRNRTKAAAAAAVTLALATGGAVPAMAATTGGGPGGPVKGMCTVKAVSARGVPVRTVDLTSLAAELGVSPSQLGQAMRTVKSSFGDAKPTPARVRAALAKILGIPLERVQRAFPDGPAVITQPGNGGKPVKIVKGEQASGKDIAYPDQGALSAAVAKRLHVSAGQVTVALKPLFATCQFDTGSAVFVKAAKTIGCSAQQLAAALSDAKAGMAAAR